MPYTRLSLHTCLCIAVLILLLAAVPAHCRWWIQIVNDDSGTVQDSTSIQLDSAVVPHVAYGRDESLLYASPVGDTWVVEEAVSPGDAQVPRYASMAIGSDEYPRIAYYDYVDRDLRYAWKDADGWHNEPVDTGGDVGDYCHLTLDDSGVPHIAYYDWSRYDLRHAWKNGDNWSTETVQSTGVVGRWPSIVATATGLHISYYADTGMDLKHAWGSPGAWSSLAFDTSGDVGQYGSMVIDSQDTHYISYYDNSNKRLKCIIGTHSQQVKEQVDQGPFVGMYSSIGLAPDGLPRVSYFSSLVGDLKYAWRAADNKWYKEIVDAGGWSGIYSCLALDYQGRPHISYIDSWNQNVKYAFWNTDTTVPPKELPDGARVQTSGMVVSAVFGDRFYMQQEDRSSGIGVLWTGVKPSVGDRVAVLGTMTTQDGERLMAGTCVATDSSGDPPVPIGMPTPAIGGGDYRYVPGPPATGQRGVRTSLGLNNIGLLVKTWGKFTYVDEHTFTVEDTDDLTVTCIVPDGVNLNPGWEQVAVTGVSSCYWSGGYLYPLLRVRSETDIVPEALP